MIRLQPRGFAPAPSYIAPSAGLGQLTASCSNWWLWLIGGAVGWAILGDVLRSGGRVAQRGAQYGFGRLERAIPERRS